MHVHVHVGARVCVCVGKQLFSTRHEMEREKKEKKANFLPFAFLLCVVPYIFQALTMCAHVCAVYVQYNTLLKFPKYTFQF